MIEIKRNINKFNPSGREWRECNEDGPEGVLVKEYIFKDVIILKKCYTMYGTLTGDCDFQILCKGREVPYSYEDFLFLVENL
jgi:hypothetical protein